MDKTSITSPSAPIATLKVYLLVRHHLTGHNGTGKLPFLGLVGAYRPGENYDMLDTLQCCLLARSHAAISVALAGCLG